MAIFGYSQLCFLVFLIPLIQSSDTSDHANHTCGGHEVKCKDGIIVPMWRPTDNLSVGDKVGRAVIYFLALGYLFLGVSVLADRFMAAIEVITSQERVVRIRKSNGEQLTVTVQIWNATVSNLTLMALGSSAPEILLSIIEVCGNKFQAGDLGPNTIVGSAAFNLFMIIAICVYVIPSNQVRRQKHLRVFFVTATWSVFAYVWLYMILAVITPNQVDWWEGLLTFLFFPLTVVMAWIADRKLLIYKYMSKTYRAGRGTLVGAERDGVEDGGAGEKRPQLRSIDGAAAVDGAEKRLITENGAIDEGVEEQIQLLEETRKEYLNILHDLRRKHPNIDLSALQQMAEYEMLNKARKSRAFYRVAAVRKLTGGGNIVRQKLQKVLSQKGSRGNGSKLSEEALALKKSTQIFFDPGHYTVLENVGTFNVNVIREGGNPELTVLVDYRTEDGTANAQTDYVAAKGTLVFMPNIFQLQIPVEIVDDDVYEDDEYFYLHLENLRIQTKDGILIDPTRMGTEWPLAQFRSPKTATIMILDDDHAGVFNFEQAAFTVSENAGYLNVKILRSSGARGLVVVPYRTLDGTAKGEKDFERKEGQLTFDDDQTEQTITIGIVNDEEYEKSEMFFIELGEPIWAKKLSDDERLISRFKKRQRRQGKEKLNEDAPKLGEEQERIAQLGRPRLGDVSKCVVKIKESYEFKYIVTGDSYFCSMDCERAASPKSTTGKAP